MSEPYRLFFPLGTLSLLWGILLWLPQIWSPGEYPVLLHRALMLNGFEGSFIAGFLMTAVPRFSKTWHASSFEVGAFLLVSVVALLSASLDQERALLIFSSLQPLILLGFMLRRMVKRKENPPYSFIFIFAGLLLWFLSGALGAFIDVEGFKDLHYEGAVASIILGVGSRLIPGILGHVEIVQGQRQLYERPVPLIATVPKSFFALVLSFIASYFMPEYAGSIVRALVVLVIAMGFWRLWKAPRERTALTWCLWTSAWMILVSFLLKALWQEGMIHASHSFFISGVVLLSLLIGTRVLVSHGPKDKTLENRRVLYVISFFTILAAATRVSAFLMPDAYLSHLGYSSLILSLAVLIWCASYLRFAVRASGLQKLEA